MSVVETLIVPDPAAGSAQTGALLVQLRAVHAALQSSLGGMDPEALHWQPAPGTNTVAMLLAHIAVVEVHLGQVGILAEKTGHPEDELGVSAADTGMPLAEDGAPPAALAGRAIADFQDMLARALAHTERVATPLSDAALDRRIERPQPAGGVRIINPRWVLHHMVEHLSGHAGQVQMLLHLHRKRGTLR